MRSGAVQRQFGGSQGEKLIPSASGRSILKVQSILHLEDARWRVIGMNLFNRTSGTHGGSTRHPAANMTWASRSVSHALTSTRTFLKRQIWLWPIIAVTLLSVLGLGVKRAIEATMQANLASQLSTILELEEKRLVTWLETQEQNAVAIAKRPEVRKAIAELLAAAKQGDSTEELAAARARVEQSLTAGLTAHDYLGFMVADRRQQVLAASSTELIGQVDVPQYREFLTSALDDQPLVSHPFPSVAALKDAEGVMRTGYPTMFVSAPVKDENSEVIAALAVRINPLNDFTQILQQGQMGDSGETYAFNRDGLMLSNSRFDHDLMLLGIIPDNADSRSMLQLLLRDPGGDMTRGYHPTTRRKDLPPTYVVQQAVAGRPGVNVAGVPDYRGVPTVVAWTWLEKYQMGLCSKANYAEAYRPLTILKRTFWGLMGLLALSSLAIFLFTIRVSKLQLQARAAAIEAKQLGQYKLEQKLGSGAMGVVYKGQHAMLRRPTAIKLLNAEKVTDQSIGRFEREVQITSNLTHPNTVQIYDYGRTPEGVFYYAMEYIDGIDLQALVETYGPQPAGRVIYLLRQICGSLYEAHSMGLVHRDIKPANLMLCRRGGEADVIKVLDFGLVKAREEEQLRDNVDDQSLAGTPLYMSPESIQTPNSVDQCSDIYAVGAVGYFLLTGRPPFEATSVTELCQKHLAEQPVAPSQRLGRPVPPELENAILSCLEKSRAKRPQTARDLSQQLNRCVAAAEWGLEDADSWWSRRDRGQLSATSALNAVAASKGTALSGRDYEATIAHGNSATEG